MKKKQNMLNIEKSLNRKLLDIKEKKLLITYKDSISRVCISVTVYSTCTVKAPFCYELFPVFSK